MSSPRALRNAFPDDALARIESAIASAETGHAGEIRVALEGDLDLAALWQGQSPRERAIEVFSKLGVWDTEHNNGVLLYVLFADRDVEIVADRGVASRVDAHEWESICHAMESEFAAGRWENGIRAGVEAVSRILASHYPPTDDRNELPDRPVFL